MAIKLQTRHRKALERLRYECDYKPGEFIGRSSLGLGAGEKTLADLETLGLLVVGVCQWHGGEAFRITNQGRLALSEPVTQRVRKHTSRLPAVPSKISPAKSRLKV